MNLRWKVIVPSAVVVLVTAGTLIVLFHDHAKDQNRKLLVENARSIVLSAEAALDEMAQKWDLGVFSRDLIAQWAKQGSVEKILAAVPISARWRTAKALGGGYEFRVPKLEPRNPENRPDEREARVLRMLKQEGLDEYFEVDAARNTLHYFRPIRLSKTCLLCHGDPATSMALWGNDRGLDPTGARMEGWKVGEVHGAFEVVRSLDATDAALAGSLWKETGFAALAILAGLLCLYWMITHGVLGRIRALTLTARGIANGDLSVEVDDSGSDEIAELGRAVGGAVVGLRAVVGQADAIAQGDFSTTVEPRSDADVLGHALSAMTKTLRDTASVCESVVAGDYSARVEVKGEKDIVGRALNQMIANLDSVIERINSAGSQMVCASREQAEGAQKQSVATEEMAATVTELLASARKMSESGATVSEQSELAASECEKGSVSVKDAVQGITGVNERVDRIATHMVELGGKSQQISGILDIISELSEQTNLLSLNASIEAAGAGEAGKRFAVVASEIRKLAERAAASTGEIHGLIDSIQETVNATIMASEEGSKAVAEHVRLAHKVDESFSRIAQQVSATTQSAKAIEMGSRQQATAIEQMESAVRNVDNAAQQTAQSARQLDAGAHALLDTARRLHATEVELQPV